MRTLLLAALAALVLATGGCGSPNQDATASNSPDLAQSTDGTTPDTARWVTTWCTLTEGMTRDEVIDAMGQPTGEYNAADDAHPQLNYEHGAYTFTVFMDTDNVVNNFWGSYDALGEQDLSQIPCRSER